MNIRQGIASIFVWLILTVPNMVHAASPADQSQGNNRESATGCGAPIDTGLSNHLNQRLLYSKLVYGKDLPNEIGSTAAVPPASQTISTVETGGRRFFWRDWQGSC